MLDEVVSSLQHQRPLANPSRDELALSFAQTANEVVFTLRRLPGIEPDSISDQDAATLGSMFFFDLFGNEGQVNLIQCLREHTTQSKWRDYVAKHVPQARQTLESLGQQKLAVLVHDWSLVESYENSQRSSLGRLILVDQKIRLVKQWQQLLNLHGEEHRQLNQLLNDHGYVESRDSTFDRRLASCITDLLKLGVQRSLAGRIHRFKPLAILADAFSFEERVKRLTGRKRYHTGNLDPSTIIVLTGQRTRAVAKEDKFGQSGRVCRRRGAGLLESLCPVCRAVRRALVAWACNHSHLARQYRPQRALGDLLDGVSARCTSEPPASDRPQGVSHIQLRIVR